MLCEIKHVCEAAGGFVRVRLALDCETAVRERREKRNVSHVAVWAV